MHATVNAPINATAAHSIQDTRVPLMPHSTPPAMKKSHRSDEVPYNVPMKYSLRSLMIVVLVGPALLAAGYFWLNDERGRQVFFGLLIGGGFVLAALVCVRIFAYANRFPKE
jgi:hypothetical protein